ncbi:MAG TPA: phosphoribosylglycinamide formyltransferase [Methylocella sp.]|nr:phosphoribosylglycinamide formyltransferase [Methylocella sp.]
MTAARKRTAVLISGRGSNLQALIARARDPSFPAEIVLVLANRPEAAGLVFARESAIRSALVDHKIYAGREEFERALQSLLDLHKIELICLAGFMRILTPWFVKLWEGRMINIHPALLPAYRGLDTHARALTDGAKIHGCTVHFVGSAMDEGPIIAQAAVAVLDEDTPQSLAARVLAEEHRVYPEALARLAEGSLKIDGNRVLTGGPRVVPPALRVPFDGDDTMRKEKK